MLVTGAWYWENLNLLAAVQDGADFFSRISIPTRKQDDLFMSVDLSVRVQNTRINSIRNDFKDLYGIKSIGLYLLLL